MVELGLIALNLRLVGEDLLLISKHLVSHDGNQDELCRKIDEGENASTWLMTPLVDRLVAADVRLQPGQCYSYGTLPVVGGKPTPENTLVLGIVEHYRSYGTVHSKLPDEAGQRE